jgi:hypothetical protein
MWQVVVSGFGQSAGFAQVHISTGTQGPKHEPSTEGTCPVGHCGVAILQSTFVVSHETPVSHAPTNAYAR